MLRERIVKGLRKHAAGLAPIFLLTGLLLIGAIPAVKPKRNFIDESAINVGRIQILLTPSDLTNRDNKVFQDQRIVYGRRSVGSEAIAVYVNTLEESSIIMANHLINVLRRKENMACDTYFYFVNDSTLHWPIPDSFVRASLVINVSSLSTNKLCFSVYGKNGMQPNQDLLNVAVALAEEWGLKVDLLCQNPHITYSVSRSIYEHYLAALQTALIAPQHPQAWYDFRSHGISVLAISTVESDKAYELKNEYFLVALHEQIITTLSYLDERFHHSTSVWVPLSVKSYIEYDIAQFGIILLVASILSTGYSIYEVEGLRLSPFVLFIWISPIFTSNMTEWFGIKGFIFSSSSMIIMWSLFEWDLSWLTINAVILCLLIILQPAAGLLIGSGVAIQLGFLHIKCRRFIFLFIGSLSSWAVFYFFVVVLGIGNFDMKTTGGIYLSVFVYSNAIWVSSRVIRSLIY